MDTIKRKILENLKLKTPEDHIKAIDFIIDQSYLIELKPEVLNIVDNKEIRVNLYKNRQLIERDTEYILTILKDSFAAEASNLVINNTKVPSNISYNLYHTNIDFIKRYINVKLSEESYKCQTKALLQELQNHHKKEEP